jgi:hypothetical protein
MNAQCSLRDQLRELVTLANREGLYDAADWVQRTLEEPKEEPKVVTEPVDDPSEVFAKLLLNRLKGLVQGWSEYIPAIRKSELRSIAKVATEIADHQSTPSGG